MSKERGTFSRRSFVAGAVMGTAGLWIQAAMPRPLTAAAARTDRAPQSLDAREWKLVRSITGRILPTDDTPGAIEADCVNFIDKALANEDSSALPSYRAALREVDRQCLVREGMGFVELGEADQDHLLVSMEKGEIVGWEAPEADQAIFFQTIRMHTILGFVLDPSHGGNRDYVGWKTMQFPGPVHHLGGSRPPHMLGTERFIPIWERGRNPHPGATHPRPEPSDSPDRIDGDGSPSDLS